MINLTKKEILTMSKKVAIQKLEEVEDLLCNTDPVLHGLEFDHLSKIYDLIQSKVDGEY